MTEGERTTMESAPPAAEARSHEGGRLHFDFSPLDLEVDGLEARRDGGTRRAQGVADRAMITGTNALTIGGLTPASMRKPAASGRARLAAGVAGARGVLSARRRRLAWWHGMLKAARLWHAAKAWLRSRLPGAR